MFLSLFFTLYVLYFSEKKAYSSEPVYFKNGELEKLTVISIHTFIASF